MTSAFSMRSSSRLPAAACTILALAAVGPAPAEDATASRPLPIERYLIAERDGEIALARSAAPAAIGSGASVLVLARDG